MTESSPKNAQSFTKIEESAQTMAEKPSSRDRLAVQDSQILLASIIKIGASKIFNLKAFSEMKAVGKPEVNTIKANKASVKEMIKNTALNGRKRKAHIALKIHGRDRIYRTKTSILRQVCIILTDLFGNSFDCSKYPALTPEQLLLVETVMHKKTGLTESFNDNYGIDKSQAERLEELYAIREFHKSTKRTEENIKFVYKHTLKFLKSQFNTEHKLRYNKESEVQFYRFYFAALAEQRETSLDLYFDPLLTNKGGKTNSKTISNSHLRLVFENEEFKSQFFAYLDDQFKEDYQSSILKKIERMFVDLENELSNKDEPERKRVMLNFINKLRQKKRVKFPWSSAEIESSRTCFYQRLGKIGIRPQ